MAGASSVGAVSGSVLVVCTANQCRSPLAEHLLQHALTSAGVDWTVSSAGFQPRAGSPLDPDVSAVLTESGVPLRPDWTSRRIDADLIARADLVLTAERVHRAAVVALVPAAVNRTFTLLEFARTLPVLDGTGGTGSDTEASTPAQLIRLAEAERVYTGPSRDSDDLADPINRGRQRFRDCAEQISRAVDRIVSCAAPGEVRTRGN